MSPQPEHMQAPGVIRVIEIVGISERSWSDAARQAVVRASQTVRHITGIEVLNSTGIVRDGKIVEYRVNLKLAFIVEPAEIMA